MRVEDLAGAQLDYWVTQYCGMPVFEDSVNANKKAFYEPVILVNSDRHLLLLNGPYGRTYYSPSSNIAQAWPLIFSLGINIASPHSRMHVNGGTNAGGQANGHWSATCFKPGNHRRAVFYHDDNPLTAAMRCFVHWHAGDEVWAKINLKRHCARVSGHHQT